MDGWTRATGLQFYDVSQTGSSSLSDVQLYWVKNRMRNEAEGKETSLFPRLTLNSSEIHRSGGGGAQTDGDKCPSLPWRSRFVSCLQQF